MMVWLTKVVVRGLQRLQQHIHTREPEHLLTGKAGEAEAYLHLRGLGYKIVATNLRLAYNRGEIDLVAWDGGVLCFVEVKTRTSADFAPPSTAVDLEKKRHILAVARRYVRRLPGDRPPPCRFDIVSVLIPPDAGKPEVTLNKGAFSWDAGRLRVYRGRQLWKRDFRDRQYWPRR